jgi:hypothetical protein
MGKRKQIKKSSTTKILGSIIAVTFTLSAGYFIYGLTKSFMNDDFSINTTQVWCANCQTYHDKATADQENNKLVWCINCNKYHAPRDETQ